MEPAGIQIVDLLWKCTHLVKVSNDLVEQPETLNTHVVPIKLNVKVIEVGNGGKQHSNLSIRLVIQILQRRKFKTVLVKLDRDILVLQILGNNIIIYII